MGHGIKEPTAKSLDGGLAAGRYRLRVSPASRSGAAGGRYIAATDIRLRDSRLLTVCDSFESSLHFGYTRDGRASILVTSGPDKASKIRALIEVQSCES